MPRRNGEPPKSQTSVRIHAENLKKIEALAETTNRTVSWYIDMAVDEYLKRAPNVESPEALAADMKANDVLLDSDDLKRITPVVEAMGKGLPLKLFIELINALRAR